MKIINRESELAILEEHYASEQAELFVLYGRRRVGKTELLRKFCQGKTHIFYTADIGTEGQALTQATRQVSLALYEDAQALPPFEDWDSLFNLIVRHAESKRLVVVIDEFTYLLEANPGIASILQRLWDSRLRETTLMLVLCGSYVGMMEEQVLGYRAPLYGRRTGLLQLRPLPFATTTEFWPAYGFEDRLRAYAIVGGMPGYMNRFPSSRSLKENVKREILTMDEFLNTEPRLILFQQLRGLNVYFSILAALAGGNTRFNQIAQAARMPLSSLTTYLNTLAGLGLIERRTPVTETQPHKSRLGLYRISDGLFRFWFRFVYPNLSQLESGEWGNVLAGISSQLDDFTAPAFEQICREAIWKLCRDKTLPLTPERIGPWWDRNLEVDILALDEKTALFAECKWTARPVGVNVLEQLQAVSREVPVSRPRNLYAIFARSGFTPALRARARETGVFLFGAELWE